MLVYNSYFFNLHPVIDDVRCTANGYIFITPLQSNLDDNARDPCNQHNLPDICLNFHTLTISALEIYCLAGKEWKALKPDGNCPLLCLQVKYHNILDHKVSLAQSNTQSHACAGYKHHN